jgi:hypothetical protein
MIRQARTCSRLHVSLSCVATVSSCAAQRPVLRACWCVRNFWLLKLSTVVDVMAYRFKETSWLGGQTGSITRLKRSHGITTDGQASTQQPGIRDKKYLAGAMSLC